MTTAEDSIWRGTIDGNYPPGTTAQQLTSCRSPNGWSALHQAVVNRHLPSDTTIEHLATTKNHAGYSALHVAARHKNLPPTTTSQNLATTRDADNHSALHEAAAVGRFPTDITTSILKETINNNRTSAWNSLTFHLYQFPNNILKLPHHLFEQDHDIAVTIINAALAKDPSLKAKAAIWLGNVVAKQPPQPDLTTPTL